MKRDSRFKIGGILKTLVLALALVATFAGTISAKKVFADNKSALTLSPMTQRIILTPGETYEGTIKVINSANSTTPMTYEALIGPYSPASADGKDDYGSFDVSTRTNHNIMMDWTTIDTPSGTLQPNETQLLTYRIQVPESAPAGSQYISILVSNITQDTNTTNNGMNIDSKVQLASIIYANVSGEIQEKGIVIENSAPTFLLNNKLEATSKVKNAGNIYTDATYSLQVWPAFGGGDDICTNEENPETSLVLPGTERYHVQTCNLPMIGIFRLKQVVSIFGEESILEKTIIVCPIWLLILILGVIVVIIVWIIFIVRKHKKPAKNIEKSVDLE